ncbi:YolD-like family protein [Ferdinandcohnia quinoae]|uniref:YolD-like family protein n=1 Tax=Fredinandcohnia quinoae TaxID=2918902 RepID=A0AAW5DW35_9BACI|nr:YolD-like family protein [Fredinandcohnia sp. SECRCQ15]MCH1624857.1 YolD-like family protein [Fredinandcohnia sp. SECRCQ15]
MKKLQGNGLWESSRMMLMEHRDAIIHRSMESKHEQMPVVDEQKQEEINRILLQAFKENLEIKISYFHEKEFNDVTGIITHLDGVKQCIKIHDDWIKCNLIHECSVK